MKLMYILLIAKLFTLFGATLNTIGFLTFFFWESLAAYRWEMILGGLALIAVSEAVGYFCAKKMSQ